MSDSDYKTALDNVAKAYATGPGLEVKSVDVAKGIVNFESKLVYDSSLEPAFKAGADWGYERGKAETQTFCIGDLKEELAEVHAELDSVSSNRDGWMLSCFKRQGKIDDLTAELTEARAEIALLKAALKEQK